MPKLKINWKIPETNGEIIIDFDEWDLTQEEWDEMDDGEKSEMCSQIVCDDESTVEYGILDSYNLVEE